MNIRLCKMTKAIRRRYYQDFVFDSDLFLDMSRFKPYEYSAEKCDALVDRHETLGRVYLAVMLNDRPIGEVILKEIDPVRKCCTLAIHLQNDSVKNRGYGTKAEKLALEYSFYELNIETVYADAVHKNKRSQHVLEKVGFRETHKDENFVCYRCDRSSWNPPES